MNSIYCFSNAHFTILVLFNASMDQGKRETIYTTTDETYTSFLPLMAAVFTYIKHHMSTEALYEVVYNNNNLWVVRFPGS